MGWEDFMVGAEYDGDQHRTSRPQYVKDLRVWPKLGRLGWHVVRAIKEDRDDDLVRQAWDAMVSRGWRPNEVCRNGIPAGELRVNACRNTVSAQN
jgi:hypothetical protein